MNAIADSDPIVFVAILMACIATFAAIYTNWPRPPRPR